MNAGLERLAEKAAEKAVEDILQKLGLDVSDPHALRADWIYIRNQRRISERITLSVRVTLITGFVTGVLGMAWAGFQQVFK